LDALVHVQRRSIRVALRYARRHSQNFFREGLLTYPNSLRNAVRIFGHFELQYTHLRLIALSNAASASESRKFLTTLSYTCLLYAYGNQAYG
jgi:hypothetical protein